MARAEESISYEENETTSAFQSAFDEEIEMMLNIDNEGLDDRDLFNVCEKSVVELTDAEDDEVLMGAVRKSEPQVAKPLFFVCRHRYGKLQWKNGSKVAWRIRMYVHHNLSPHDYVQGDAIGKAFYQSVCDHVQQDRVNPYSYHYRFLLEIHYNKCGIKNVLSRSPLLPVHVWINNSERIQQWIQQLSIDLKSLQNMDVSEEEFFAELSMVKPLYTGCRFMELNENSFEEFLKKKRSVVDLRHFDTLCCANAIVFSKTLIDEHYYPCEPYLYLQAKQLHQDAQVPEKACGTATELDTFQTYLAPQYQLIVLDGFRGEIVYKNPTYELAKHVIALLKMKEHYYVITSLPAFFKSQQLLMHLSDRKG